MHKIVISFTLILLFTAACSSSVSQEDYNELAAQIDAMQNEIETLKETPTPTPEPSPTPNQDLIHAETTDQEYKTIVEYTSFDSDIVNFSKVSIQLLGYEIISVNDDNSYIILNFKISNLSDTEFFPDGSLTISAHQDNKYLTPIYQFEYHKYLWLSEINDEIELVVGINETTDKFYYVCGLNDINTSVSLSIFALISYDEFIPDPYYFDIPISN